MAIVISAVVEAADQQDHDRLQDAVNSAIGQLGAPPDGLMVHLGHPFGDGFVIVDVWRTEDLGRAFWSGVMEPAIAAAGLAVGEPEISPAWSLARP